jgi:spoIIIJ-associated protein
LDKIEATGRTLEEALQSAAQQLHVSVDAVDYEVVEEGAKGFLGLGQTPTLVKAWIGDRVQPARPAVREAPSEIEEEAIEEEEVIEEEEEPVSPPSVVGGMSDAEPEPEVVGGISDVEEEPEVVGGVSDAELSVVGGVSDAEPAAAVAPPVAGEDEFVDAVIASLTDILGPMGADARPVLRSADEEEVVVDLVGPDVAILIGRRGQTLDALQYLVGLIAGKRFPNRRRVVLDAEHYRDRHRELLESKAHEYAMAVKAEGSEAVLEPQPARDRRIIHVALADDPDVYTYSEGDGEDRHVVISPKK